MLTRDQVYKGALIRCSVSLSWCYNKLAVITEPDNQVKYHFYYVWINNPDSPGESYGAFEEFEAAVP